jgi:signal transduction protein with GAF and PtsI domain
MAPACIGPIKAMLLTLDAGSLERWLRPSIAGGKDSLRARLKRFAEEQGVEV